MQRRKNKACGRIVSPAVVLTLLVQAHTVTQTKERRGCGGRGVEEGAGEGEMACGAERGGGVGGAEGVLPRLLNKYTYMHHLSCDN